MDVDVASPLGGVIPVDPIVAQAGHPHRGRRPVPRRRRPPDEGHRLAGDRRPRHGRLRHRVPRRRLGCRLRLRFSDALGEKITEANAAGKVIGGVCHGPLGLLNATGADGDRWSRAARISAVTDKQVARTRHRVDAAAPGDRAARRRRRSSRARPGSATRSPTTGSSTATSSPARTRTPDRWSPGR